MPVPLNIVRRQVVRLKAISRKLNEIKYGPIREETDILGVIVWAMSRKLESCLPDAPETARARPSKSDAIPPDERGNVSRRFVI